MYGDNNYRLISSGSTGASANTAHKLVNFSFDNYNDGHVCFLSVMPVANNFRLFDNISASNGVGIRMMSGGSMYFDMPPMKVSQIRNLHFKNETDGNNAEAYWSLWSR